MKYDSNGDINCNWNAGNGLERLGKESGRIGNRDHSDYSILKIV